MSQMQHVDNIVPITYLKYAWIIRMYLTMFLAQNLCFMQVFFMNFFWRTIACSIQITYACFMHELCHKNTEKYQFFYLLFFIYLFFKNFLACVCMLWDLISYACQTLENLEHNRESNLRLRGITLGEMDCKTNSRDC